ncbi:hypothetical protein, partial [Streptomyces chryseus]
ATHHQKLPNRHGKDRCSTNATDGGGQRIAEVLVGVEAGPGSTRLVRVLQSQSALTKADADALFGRLAGPAAGGGRSGRTAAGWRLRAFRQLMRASMRHAWVIQNRLIAQPPRSTD